MQNLNGCFEVSWCRISEVLADEHEGIAFFSPWLE